MLEALRLTKPYLRQATFHHRENISMLRIFLIILLIGCGVSASAGTTPNSYITPQVPNRGLVQFFQGTDAQGTLKTLYTSGANGSRCYGGWVTSTDSVPHPVYIRLINGDIDFGGAAFVIGPTAGVAPGAPPLAWMTQNLWGQGIPIDEYGNPYIQLIPGDSLKAVYTGSFTSGNAAISVYAACSDF
jgi:hypothetical protein